MRNPIIIPESDLQEYIDNTYAFVLLLTGDIHSAEEITVRVISKDYFNHSGELRIARCLKSAYRKCYKCEYISDDDYLMKRLALLTFSERGLVLLKYRYRLSESIIGEIMKIRKSKVKSLARQALEKLMRSGEDGSMCVSECRYSENIF